jgi:hypothetical protein
MTLEGGGGGGGVLGGVKKAFGGAAKAVTDVTKAVVQPVYNATLKNIPGVDNALVGLDKAVGSTIPGGWGTVVAMATPFIPGSQFAASGTLGSMGITKTGLATGLGALSGSGVMKKGHEFNLQGAIMGGAMAYGGAKLAEGLQAAGATKSIEEASREGLTSAASNSQTPVLGAEMLDVNAGLAGTSPPPPMIDVSTGLAPPPPPLPEFYQAAQSNIDPSLLEGMSREAVANAPVLNSPPPSGIGNLLAGTGSNLADAGRGLANLSGLGSQTGAQSAAIDALTNKFGLGAGTALITGAGGLMAIEEQKKMLTEQLAQGTIAQSEYNAALAEINRQEQFARETVAANPLRTDSGIAGSLSGSGNDSAATYETLYDATPSSAGTLYASTPSRSGVYARGGEVEDYGLSNLRKYALGGVVADDYSGYGPLDQGFDFNYPQQNQVNSNYPSPSNFDRPQSGPTTPSSYYQNTGLDSLGGYGSGMGYAAGGYAMGGYATGGEPRFLSGGGDGMSDSIRANINGNQEARLADGEFVIPADVVSHLGNGSSKAGAKQLYTMMDRARKARTGRKSQGKQINPRKYMPA